MHPPFTVDQFLYVFKIYNLAIWPFQIVLNLLAVGVVVLAMKPSRVGNRIISCILAFFWLWIGTAYHFAYFTSINRSAYLFGALNTVQGFLFLYAGMITGKLRFKFIPDGFGVTGAVFVLYALVIYPLLGSFNGHVYPEQPTFGLPCPTTIFTFGVLLWSIPRIPKYLLAIPLLWSLVGFSATINLGMVEDFGLPLAGIAGTTMLFVRDRIPSGIRSGYSCF